MRSKYHMLAGVLALCLPAGVATASSSDWTQVEGARVRLTTSGGADAEGRLKGVLDIDLRPGWKTYWRDPGDAGVPPTIDVSKSRNVDRAELLFPAPERHVESDFTWAGYSRPVALPVILQVVDPAAPAIVEADVFLGICQEICVPLQATLTVTPADDPDNADDRSAVDAAFEALPAPATPTFGVRIDAVEGDLATFRAILPADAKAVDFFLAASDDYAFGTPKMIQRGAATLFQLKVMRPDPLPKGGALAYTLVSDKGAVSGTIPYF